MEPKKTLILETAYDVLIERGIESLSMSRIASKAGIPASLIFHYFKNKELLIKELAEFILEKYSVHIDQHLDIKLNITREGFLKFVDSLFLIDKAEKRLLEGFYACYYLAMRNVEIQEAVCDCLMTVRGILKKNLTLFAEKGLIQSENETIAIDYIISSVAGFAKMGAVECNKISRNEKLITLHKKNILELLHFEN